MIKKLLAEFLGTMFFLYVILATGDAVAIGLALTVAIMVIGKHSGGHFNPAVSLMMLVKGKLNTHDGMLYVLSQVLGGMLALALYKQFKL